MVLNLNPPVQRPLVPARDLKAGAHVYLDGVERVVRRVRPYRLFTVVDFQDGPPARIPHTVRLTVWTVDR